MLSLSAFNALLKTLEEPPKQTVFVLATTEVHKLPATILSRCIRFDFKLVPLDILTNHLNNILSKEGVKFEDTAVNVIARAIRNREKLPFFFFLFFCAIVSFSPFVNCSSASMILISSYYVSTALSTQATVKKGHGRPSTKQFTKGL